MSIRSYNQERYFVYSTNPYILVEIICEGTLPDRQDNSERYFFEVTPKQKVFLMGDFDKIKEEEARFLFSRSFAIESYRSNSNKALKIIKATQEPFPEIIEEKTIDIAKVIIVNKIHNYLKLHEVRCCGNLA